MKEKVLKINKKDYNIAKSLSDRDFGTLVRALCEYVYYGIDASPKDKILKVYYDNFKEKIDMENFFRETGRICLPMSDIAGICCCKNLSVQIVFPKSVKRIGERCRNI